MSARKLVEVGFHSSVGVSGWDTNVMSISTESVNVGFVEFDEVVLDIHPCLCRLVLRVYVGLDHLDVLQGQSGQ